MKTNYQDMLERVEKYPCVRYNRLFNVKSKKKTYFHWNLVKSGINKMLLTVFNKIVMNFYLSLKCDLYRFL